MDIASPFRSDGPPALTSERSAADFNEIKSLGCLDCPARSEEQRIIGLFYTDVGLRRLRAASSRLHSIIR